MLIFYSALRVIPSSLYEAAEIDGAGQIRIIGHRASRHPQRLVIATIFSIIGSFQLFNEPSILRPLARNAITTDYTPNFYTYSLSFNGQQRQLLRGGRHHHGADHHGHRLCGQLAGIAREHDDGAAGGPVATASQPPSPSPADPRTRPACALGASTLPDAQRSVLLTVLTGLIMLSTPWCPWCGWSSAPRRPRTGSPPRPACGSATSSPSGKTSTTRSRTATASSAFRWLLNTLLYVVLRRRRDPPGDPGQRAGEVQLPGKRAVFAVVIGAVAVPGTALAVPTA